MGCSASAKTVSPSNWRSSSCGSPAQFHILDAFDGVDGLIEDLPVGRRDDVVSFQTAVDMPATDAFYGRGDRAKAADDGPRPRA